MNGPKLEPVARTQEEVLGPKARVDDGLCLSCGQCIPHCPTGALGFVSSVEVRVDAARCDGCGACGPVCPGEAIAFDADAGA